MLFRSGDIMDYQKFTEKSLSAIAVSEQTAREYGNPEIKQEHLLYALLVQDNGLIPEVLKSGVRFAGAFGCP